MEEASHRWARAETNQALETAYNNCERWTRFPCKRCPATVLHFYLFHLSPAASQCEFRVHPVCEASTDAQRGEAEQRLAQVRQEAAAEEAPAAEEKDTQARQGAERAKRQSSRSRSRSRSRSASPERAKRRTASPSPSTKDRAEDADEDDEAVALRLPSSDELAVLDAGRVPALKRYLKHCLLTGAMQFNADSKECTVFFLPSPRSRCTRSCTRGC